MKCELLISFVFILIIFLNGKWRVFGEVFTLGYITGSQRRPGDMEYPRPGEFYAIIIKIHPSIFLLPHIHFDWTIQYSIRNKFLAEVSTIKQTLFYFYEWNSDEIIFIQLSTVINFKFILMVLYIIQDQRANRTLYT